MRSSIHQALCGTAAITVVVLSTGVAEADSVQPLLVPPEAITSRVETVVIEPLLLTNFPIDGKPRRLRDEWARITHEAFAERGYEVIATDEFERVWLETATRMGGLFDPATGVAAEERLRVVREHTLAELGRIHSVDASVRARIAVAPMPTYEKISGLGFITSGYFVGDEAVTWSNGQALLSRPERVVGPYLHITVVDTANVPLYAIRVRMTWSRVYAQRDYFERPAEFVYFNPIGNLETLGIALEKFPAQGQVPAGD